MAKVDRIQEKLARARAQVAKLEAEFAEARLKELQKVEVSQNGETLTLTFGDRVLKAKKHSRYNRWNVFESGRKIVSEYLYGIHDLRFDIARGAI
jgi:hypothetical protein